MSKWGGCEMSVVGGLQSLGQISRGAAKAISAARSRSATSWSWPLRTVLPLLLLLLLLKSLFDPPVVPLLFVVRWAHSVVHVRTDRVISARLTDETHASPGVEAPTTFLFLGLSRHQDRRDHRAPLCRESSRMWVVDHPP